MCKIFVAPYSPNVQPQQREENLPEKPKFAYEYSLGKIATAM